MATYAPIECPYCGKLFKPKRFDQKFCCKNHGRRYNAEKAYKDKKAAKLPPKECIVCGTLFIPEKSTILCCSPECSRQHDKECSRRYYQRAKDGFSNSRTAPCYGLNVDPYKTGALRSDAQFCPVI